MFAGYLTVLNPIVRECSSAIMQVSHSHAIRHHHTIVTTQSLQFIDAIVSSAAAAAAAADVVALPLVRKDVTILSQIDWMCRERFFALQCTLTSPHFALPCTLYFSAHIHIRFSFLAFLCIHSLFFLFPFSSSRSCVDCIARAEISSSVQRAFVEM